MAKIFEKVKRKAIYFFKFTDGLSSTYPDGKRITNEDVYQYVKKHSRLIDRLNPRRMVCMTFMAFDLLGACRWEQHPDEVLKENWKFFDDFYEPFGGKHPNIGCNKYW